MEAYYVFWKGHRYYDFVNESEANAFARYWGAIYYRDLPH